LTLTWSVTVIYIVLIFTFVYEQRAEGKSVSLIRFNVVVICPVEIRKIFYVIALL